METNGTSTRPTVDHWRQSHNITLDEMAEALGYTKGMVSHYMSGKRELNESFFFRFLRAYGRPTFNALFPEMAIK